MNNISRLEKRAIEASAIAPVIRKLSEILGQKDARALLEDINQREAYERGRNMAQYKQGNSIEILAKDVATWGEDGAWEMDVLEQTSTTYFFNVTRCPYYEKYCELGLEEFGVEFSCCRDEPFARGLNPKLKLERTKTIMQGGDICDFRYHLLPQD
ncbi:MAG: L-2-amino-thiazoline-4-carboxylic acid hydrolase [Desulfofustis sp.]|jgi:hypothetical protein